MISLLDLSRALQKEWHRLEMDEWQTTDYIKGIIQGLRVANAIAKDLWEEAKGKESPNPSGNKNSYLKAIITAHRQLKSYERSHALQTLERVIDRADVKAKAMAL